MPTIYRIEDGKSSERAAVDSVLAGQVILDGKTSGKTMAGDFQALLIAQEIIPLRHPLESSALKAKKESYLSASLKGILLRVERRICLGCGNIFDAPRITFSGAAGCLPALLLATGSFAFTYFVFGKSIGDSLVIAWIISFASCLVVDLAGTLYLRLRFSERQAKIAQRNCPTCGSAQSFSLASIVGKRIEIGNEGKWLKVSIAGKA